MARCEECGSDDVAAVRIEGVAVHECGLCGALSGDDASIARVMQAREARLQGIDPAVFPLVLALRRIPDLQVVAAEAGDPGARVWPFVQLAPAGPGAWKGVEGLVKSLALSARGHDVHWVVEVEFQNRLMLTLKPRFHRDVGAITPELVETAVRDLDRVRRNLEAHMRLSWWG